MEALCFRYQSNIKIRSRKFKHTTALENLPTIVSSFVIRESKYVLTSSTFGWMTFQIFAKVICAGADNVLTDWPYLNERGGRTFTSYSCRSDKATYLKKSPWALLFAMGIFFLLLSDIL